jgi:hypothetical protein
VSCIVGHLKKGKQGFSLKYRDKALQGTYLFTSGYLLYTYLNRKQRLHINFQSIKNRTLISEKKIDYHHYHHNLLIKNIPLSFVRMVFEINLCILFLSTPDAISEMK